MQITEKGASQASDRYFFTPSSLARELFYYLTRCGHYLCSSQYAFSHQSEIALQGDHNQNIMLFLIQEGAMEIEIGGVSTLAAAGQTVIFDCHEPYRYQGMDGLEFTWLLFNGSNTRDFYRRILQTRSGRHVFAPLSAKEIARLMGQLLNSCKSGGTLSEASCSQLIHRLLCLLLLDERDVTQDDGDLVVQAVHYIRQHLSEPISVQEVASAVGLSSSHFSREFKSRMGYSPYEYILMRRIDRAKHLLTSTRKSVSEIAYASGYNSEENFIHSFQKHAGVTPGRFRKYPV